MKNILMLIFVFSAFDAFAGIRVYHAETKQEIKEPLEYLTKQGAIPSPGELTEEQFKNMSNKEFNQYLNQTPDSHKNVENQKNTGLGTVLYFTDIKTLEPKASKVMNKLGDIEDVRVIFYLKEPRTTSAMSLIGMKLGQDFKYQLKMDADNKTIRRLHVSSFPTIVYIDPNKNKSTYSGSSGGVTALKMRINELKAMQKIKSRQY